MFCALHTGRAPFGYLDWFTTAIWAAFANMVGGIGLVTVLRMLQVPERVARRRAEPSPEVVESTRRRRPPEDARPLRPVAGPSPLGVPRSRSTL